MNTIITSKEDILKTSRELIREQGWSAVNIRSVAAACGVSVGSIYNYFDSKADLVGETVESVWCQIFHQPEDGAVFQDTQTCIIWMYERMEYGCREYPGFFTLHSLGFMRENKLDGKRRMQQSLAAYSGWAVSGSEAGCQGSAGCFYRTIHGGEVCRRPVFADAVCFTASGL